MARCARITQHVWLVTCVILSAACSEGGSINDPVPYRPPSRPPTTELLISEPVLDGEALVAYVSLLPGTNSHGFSATVSARSQATTPVIDGGFDPVAVLASVGDTVRVVISDGDGGLTRIYDVVPAQVSPRMLRTSPSRAETGVPTDVSILVVFSEPIAAASITDTAVQLWHGSARVQATVRQAVGRATALDMVPLLPLQSETTYAITLSPGIRDRSGAALDSGNNVLFTTRAAPPSMVGSLVVSTITTGDELDADGYQVTVDSSRSFQVGANDSLTIADLAPAVRTVELTGVADNCWPNGDPRRVVTITGGDKARVTFALTCELRSPLHGPDALVGVWQAVHWQFFATPELSDPVEDVIAGGMAGTLTVTRLDAQTVQWHWRETYRWWGPDRPTLIAGHATVQGWALRSTVDSVWSEFECDWGDCDGPLHGDHTFVRFGGRLVITRPESVGYYRGSGPHAAWTRLVLTRVQ